MSLIKHSIYNLAGFVIPTIVAIPSLGILARTLGTESFGLFTLAFAVVGYASIFDAGLTRAVIREISIFRDDVKERNNIISTSTITVAVLGLFAAMLIFFSVEKIGIFLNVSRNLLPGFENSFKLLSLAVPIFLVNQIWLASLEGMERFGNINIQRTITSSCLAIFPALFAYFGNDLYSAILGLLIGRIGSLIVSFIFSYKLVIAAGLHFNFKTIRRLIMFGGWITVSNVISPVMVYFDRFVISHVLGASKVAFYTAPSEAVARLLNIPAALSRALFPKLSSNTATADKNKLERMSYLLMFGACLPIVIIGFIFANKIMIVWMGPAYAGQPATILRILLIGFIFNALAQIPFSKIQAAGYAKITATLHLCELVPYLIALYYLTIHFSLIGTAVAWALRVSLDFLVLYILSRKKYVAR
jgi:O-antigen/teichoic acid export membrane protein